ncbi:mechanosensitive ion channel family protein [Halomicroarcula sp. F28]|uniref:Mechanosensitive ion channel family protein n=1 Tax=Haloarcula salinisoli TaxID=2487746 RepID=A0A8J7YNI2_9EURY|nr:mechanosensitive ion channel family protein [Halomicroarcula salinisoli]MBX0305016.1 mechanosensitive ion channel family protein [Halomicroarcula salinisoli]
MTESVQQTETAATDANEGLLDLIRAFQETLEGLATSQGRVVATALLLAVLLVTVVVIPAVLSRLRTVAIERMGAGSGSWLQTMAAYTPTTFRGLLLRMAQFTVVSVVVVSFLVVWGITDVAAALRPFLADRDPTLVPTIQTIVLIMLAFVASDQLQRWIDRFSTALSDFTEHQEEILLRVGQVTIFVVVGATIFAVWSINIGGLLVGAGFLGIVVGFAARQTLGSLIAGFVLMFSRPFTIGDWVAIGDEEGIVTDITIFNTRLENFDGEFVVLPNDRVSDSAITNRSRKGLLRLTLDIGVDYDTDVDAARELARETMVGVSDVVDSPPPQVVPKSFGDSAVVLELRFWIDHPTPPRKWRAVSAVVRAVKSSFDEEDIDIPFPQRTLTVRDESSATERPRGVHSED